MPTAVIFDLDDTLYVEEPAIVDTFLACASLASAVHPRIDAEALALDARTFARELWHAAPTHAHWERVGMSSWEALWCRWEAEHEPTPETRAWAPGFRTETWRLALAAQHLDDALLADTLGDRFVDERRMRHRVFTDAGPVLDALADDGHRLGLITNGESGLQREKLDATGLADRFHAVVVSGDHGYGKPDPAIFALALERLGIGIDRPQAALMVGDNPDRDFGGAVAAGLHAAWLDRRGPHEDGDDGEGPVDPPDVRITSLREVPDLAERLGR